MTVQDVEMATEVLKAIVFIMIGMLIVAVPFAVYLLALIRSKDDNNQTN